MRENTWNLSSCCCWLTSPNMIICRGTHVCFFFFFFTSHIALSFLCFCAPRLAPECSRWEQCCIKSRNTSVSVARWLAVLWINTGGVWLTHMADLFLVFWKTSLPPFVVAGLVILLICFLNGRLSDWDKIALLSIYLLSIYYMYVLMCLCICVKVRCCSAGAIYLTF